MAEDLLVEITKLFDDLEKVDCATAVDDLCQGTLESKIKEIKSSTSRPLHRALERYFGEYIQKLLRTYAKKLKSDRLRLKKLSSRIESFLEQVQPIPMWAVDIYRLRDEVKEALVFFSEKLWFLPDRGDRKQLERWILREFRKWYDPDPLDKLLSNQLAKLEELLLAIPSAVFRQFFPENPETILVPQVPECSMCDSEDPRRIHFCKRCSKDNIPCYSCFCKHAWSRQHDEYRVFSELRNIDCPYCRSEYVIGDAYTVIQCK